MDYQFERFVNTRKGNTTAYDGISVGPSSIVVGKVFAEKLDGYGFVEISYDKKHKVIAINPTKAKGHKIKRTEFNTFIYARLIPVMPRGRYYFKEKTEQGYICVQE